MDLQVQGTRWKGAVGTRGYYGVLPSDRNVPYIHGVYNIVPPR